MGEGLAGGFEIGDLCFDDKAGGLQVLLELLAGEPVELLAGFVGGGALALVVVNLVTVLAMEDLFFAVDLMFRVYGGELTIIEQRLVIGIPLIFRQFAEDFGERGEGTDVERTMVIKHGGEVLQRGYGIAGELQGKSGHHHAGVGLRCLPVIHVSLVQHQPGVSGLSAAEI